MSEMHKIIIECLRDVRMLKMYGVGRACSAYLRLIELDDKLKKLELMTLTDEK